MNNEDEIIEILDDFENDDIVISQNNISESPATNNSASFDVNTVAEKNSKNDMFNEMKKVEAAKYSSIEPEISTMNVETDDKDEESKSGLGFVIVLFILLAAFIIALPYISKLF